MVFLGTTKKIHLVGIGGVGMSGIAEVLLNLRFRVSGSDLKLSKTTARLSRMGAEVMAGHREGNVEGSDVVVYSSAIPADNPELVAARRAGIPVIPRTEMLAELMRMKFAITVAGSHGKTSTTTLIGAVLASGGLDPTVVVGGRIGALGSHARLGRGKYLVAEADESDGEFVKLPSTIAVVTTVDREHLDHYRDLDQIKDVFVQYAGRVPFYGAVVLCKDDENIRSIMGRITRRKITYGLQGDCDLKGRITTRDPGGNSFVLSCSGKEMGPVRIPIPGDHYVLNALAAVAVGMELGIPFPAIKRGLESFGGVGRRFEIKGEVGGITVVDDYGHHPTEIAATIAASLANFGRRVIVLFQPHRYTRTQALAESFGPCFRGAAKVYVTDVYPAGEEPIPGVDAGLIVAAVEKAASAPVEYVGSMEEMVNRVRGELEPGDIVITMGAGSIYRAGELLLERLRQGGGE